MVVSAHLWESLAESGLDSFLSEEIPEAECRFPVDFVVGGFSGVLHSSHAFPAVARDDGLLHLPLPLACRPGADGPLDAWFAHAEFHGVFFLS